MTDHNCEWKRKYLGMVKERDDQIRRKREARRILTERFTKSTTGESNGDQLGATPPT